MKHAFLSPSGAPAWLRCNAKVWREKDLPNESSDFANEGTAAHYLLSESLTSKRLASTFEGLIIGVDENGACWNDGPVKLNYRVTVDRPMSAHIQKTLDWVNGYQCAQSYAERTLSISHITGEADAEGTVDVTQLAATEICITDLKYGMGVQVYAEENEQLIIYADAALEEFDVLGEIETVRMRIAQPRLDHFDEWAITVAELKERIEKIRKTAKIVMTLGKIALGRPGEKQCKFCRAKATCAEYREHVLEAVTFEPVVDLKKGEIAVSLFDAERIIAQAYGVKPKDVSMEMVDNDASPDSRQSPVFILKKPSIGPQVEAATVRIATESDEQLATVMGAADMIEGFVKAVRAEVERRLLLGTFTDARYKLVEGKKGSRAWIDADEAKKQLKAMRLKVDQMYDMKIKSPTQIELQIKEANPRKWAKLQEQITQGGGKPSVAPASDKRPALNVAVQFDPVPDEKEYVEWTGETPQELQRDRNFDPLKDLENRIKAEDALLGLSVEDDLI